MSDRPYHHGNLRQALIQSALRVMSEQGIRNLTLRNVARDAGVAPSALYRHYASKDALLAGVAQDSFARLIRRGESEIARHSSNPAALYRGLLETYVGFALENPDRLRLMFSSAIEDRTRYPELQETSARSFAQMLDTVKQCQASGVIARGKDPQLVAVALWSMLHGLSILTVEGQLAGVTTAQKARVLTRALGRLVLEGLGS